MKTTIKFFTLLAAVSTLFVSCSKEQDVNRKVEPKTDKVVSFRANVKAIDAETKATLTPDATDASFAALWSDGDAISVEYINGDNDEGVVPATWSFDEKCFHASGLPSYKGVWVYTAYYPAKTNVAFSKNRIQNGNNYSSQYDLMIGSASATDANEGQDDAGNPIVFEMERKTAILYFHLTSDLDEDVVSATLTVEGDPIAANEIADITTLPSGEDNSITITFQDGTAPKATDFKLWYNVLPSVATGMTLEIVTTNHRAILTNTNGRIYEAEKLYRIKKSGLIWVDSVSEESYTIEFGNNANSATQIQSSTLASTTVTSESAAYLQNKPYSDITNAYYGDTKACIRLGKSGSGGALKIGLSETGQKKAKKIVVNCMRYGSDDASLSVNNSAMQVAPSSADDLTFIFNAPSTITDISLTSNKRVYIYSITVYYDALSKGTLPTPSHLAVNSQQKKLTWDKVTGAASYKVSIGSVVTDAIVNTNEYDASTIADDYYNVSVVAVPANTTYYDESAAATLSEAKFGTPKLGDITFSNTVTVTENSIEVSWTSVAHATKYHCSINPEHADAQDVTDTSVKFECLTTGETYAITVYAIDENGLYNDSESATKSGIKAEGNTSYTLTFPDDNSGNNGLTSGQYESTWTARISTFNWTITNFNNNNWAGGWTYIKCGRKSNTSVATITTASAIPEAIKKVTITIDALTASKINSIKLFISSDGSNWAAGGEFTKAVGEQTVTIASPTADKYYKLEFDCASGSSNGLLTLSKIVYSAN